MAREKKQKTKAMKIDFGGVPEEKRRRSKRIPEGDYKAKIIKHEKKKSDRSGAYYLTWQLQIIESAGGSKKQAGVPIYTNTSLKPDALFNLRNLVLAATNGKTNLAGKVVNFDPRKYYGKEIGITVEDEEYEKDNKTVLKSGVADFLPVSELVEEEDDSDDEEDESEDEEDSEDEDESEDETDDSEESEDEDSSEDDDSLDDVDLDEDL